MNKTQEYAVSLYARMEEESEEIDGKLIWKGRLVDTCAALGIPVGGYNRAVNLLRKSNCIEQISRGFRGEQQSTFRLIRVPTQEVWDEIVKSRDRALTNAPSLDILRQEIRDMQKQIGGINVVDAMANFEQRIKKLETAIRQHNHTNTQYKGEKH